MRIKHQQRLFGSVAQEAAQERMFNNIYRASSVVEVFVADTFHCTLDLIIR
jgi:hypothetical protein